MRKDPLHVAVIKGDAKKVSDLLQKGKSPNVQWVQGYTALHLAADEVKTDVASVLLRAGADIRARAGKDGETPLHIAAQRGATEIVKALLTAGAKVTDLDGRKRTPLHYAASGYEGTLTTVELLLEAGAKVDVRDVEGDTPL